MIESGGITWLFCSFILSQGRLIKALNLQVLKLYVGSFQTMTAITYRMS